MSSSYYHELAQKMIDLGLPKSQIPQELATASVVRGDYLSSEEAQKIYLDVIAAKQPPKPKEKTKPKTQRINDDWDRNPNNTFKGTYNNCLLFIEKKNLNFRLNLFSDEIEYNGKKYDDRTLLKVKEMMRPMKLEPSIATIDEAIITHAQNNSYHPVRDYIKNLTWDGKSRVNTWLNVIGGASKCNYTSFVGRTMLVAAINRVFKPGCQYDYMPIIEGNQGIGKSRLVRCLGGPWYKEISLTERDKDTIQKMQGAWFIEVAELAVFGKRDRESLKAFITTPIDHARFAYARKDKAFPRQSTFIGTINPSNTGYLLDETGNRRFLPITLKFIDITILEKFRDQLFAEAYQMYLAGNKIYIDDSDLHELAKNNQSDREEQDDWTEVILNGIQRRRLDIGRYMTAINIYTNLIGGSADRYDQKINRRISNIMTRLMCGKSSLKKINGVTGRYYDLTKLFDSYEERKPVDNPESNSK